MAVWLITGATGFVGRHVLHALASGVDVPPAPESAVMALGRRQPAGWPDSQFICADLEDAASVRRVVADVAPDYVIHTAGRTPPARDDELYRANFWSTIHLMSALRSTRKPMRVVLSGSAAELGPVPPAKLPVGEDYVGCPTDAYGRSKCLANRSGLAERPPMEIMVARIFNAIGPGMAPTHAFGSFAERLRDPGADPVTLTVGDLDASRDFVDVRDVARAMIALALRGQAGQVYNVATGRSRRVGEGLDALMRLSGRSVRVVVDPAIKSRRGPADSCAAIDRIVAQTGWTPSIPWETSLGDLWREAEGHSTSPRWSAA
jgi:GDP-4-dehydro-6-deoxy-D-mannose reductase